MKIESFDAKNITKNIVFLIINIKVIGVLVYLLFSINN